MQQRFRVFLSAVSGEFHSAREWVASDLRARGLEVKEQRDFRQEGDADTTLRKLHDYIAGCDAVVAVVGTRSGAKPPPAAAAPFADMLPDGVAEASYTQWEVHFARRHRRRLYFYVAGAGWTPDEPKPNGPDDPALQAALVHRLFKVEGLDRRAFCSVHELRAEVLRQDWPDLRAVGSTAPMLSYASDVLTRFGVAQAAPPAFRAGAEQFIASYLGTAERAVPFGGRGPMLERLDRWLDDPASPHRLLLHAPGGRGKSALVVHWLERVAARCHPVFLPVSVRFGTNRAELFYHALAARLAELLGAELRLPTADPVGHYKGFAIDLLRRAGELDRPVLLVVDGLDEATGWRLDPALLPHEPAPKLRVLVSAREQTGDHGAEGWLGRLRWDFGSKAETIEVGPLDDEGISDVLRGTGDALAGLAGEQEVVKQLARLTGGDPLLVRLYAEDLRKRGEGAARLQPEDLAKLEPGFGSFFRGWLDDQESLWRESGQPIDQDTVDLVLSLLACALGPLGHADLAGLCRRLRGETFALRARAMEALSRFVLGDGMEQRGYVLAHPKLADHLRREYFKDPAIIAAVRAAFLEWGRDTLARLNAGKLRTEGCPSYLLLYLGQHLEEAGAAAADFMGLVEEGWLRAWEAFGGGYRGFSQDVRRAADAAAREPVGAGPRWAWQLRCQLVLSSIASIGSQIPSSLLVETVANGVLPLRQALHWLEYGSDEARAEALAALAPRLPEALLGDALGAARAIGDDEARAEVLTALAPRLPEAERAGVLGEALGAARAIGDDEARAEVLTALAPRLPEAERAGVLVEALRAARAIGLAEARAEALAALAPSLPEALLGEALRAAAAVGDDETRAEALAALAPSLPEALLGEALRAAAAIGDDEARAEVLAALAPRLPEAERASVLGEALRAARAIEYDEARAEALAALAPRLPEALLGEALRVAGAIEDERNRVQALAALAPRLPEAERAGALGEALRAARAIEHNRSRAQALAALAPSLPEAERAGILGEALRAAAAIKKDRRRAWALTDLAPSLPEVLLGEALAATSAIEGERRRAEALAALAPSLQEALLAEALRAARAIEYDEARAEALAALAPRLPEAERAGVLGEALRAARAIGDDEARAQALAALAPSLPEALLGEALRAAAAIGDDEARAEVLATLAPRLPEAERAGVLGEALGAARAIGDDEARAQALAALAPSLPEALLGEALRAAAAIRDDEARAEVLAALAPRLPEAERASVLGEALRAARAIEYDEARAEALAALAPRLPEALLGEALRVAGAIEGERNRVQALAALAPHLPEAERAGVLGEALRAARAIEGERNRAQALAALAPHLPEAERAGVLGEALRAARAIEDEWNRAWALAALAPSLPEALLGEALGTARAIEDERNRAQALAALAPRLPEAERAGVLVEALRAARAIGLAEARAEALAALAPSLPKAERAGVLGEALGAARAIGLAGNRAQALAALAPHLPEALLGEALGVARAIGDDEVRAQALAALAPRLPEAERAGVLGEALGAARAIEGEWNRAWALAALAPSLPEALLGEALGVARAIGDDEVRARALAALAPSLPETLQESALISFIQSVGQVRRANFLGQLANFLDVVVRLTGPMGLYEIRRAVRDTGNWFQ